MNLENLNVVELDAQEKVKIDGGVPWWLWVANPAVAYISMQFESGVEEGCECQIDWPLD